jgi:hypothetical protein
MVKNKSFVPSFDFSLNHSAMIDFDQKMLIFRDTSALFSSIALLLAQNAA